MILIGVLELELELELDELLLELDELLDPQAARSRTAARLPNRTFQLVPKRVFAPRRLPSDFDNNRTVLLLFHCFDSRFPGLERDNGTCRERRCTTPKRGLWLSPFRLVCRQIRRGRRCVPGASASVERRCYQDVGQDASGRSLPG
jgi:hypothetical protein